LPISNFICSAQVVTFIIEAYFELCIFIPLLIILLIFHQNAAVFLGAFK